MNFSNQVQARGYVRRLKFQQSADFSQVHFLLVVKRSYKSTVQGVKKYEYDTIACKATNKRAIAFFDHVIEGMWIEISGTLESYSQWIVNNQLTSERTEDAPMVMRHTVALEEFHTLESKESVQQREQQRQVGTAVSTEKEVESPVRQPTSDTINPIPATRRDYSQLYEEELGE